ncbi:MAG: hypothetical protein ACYDEI_00185 [Erysipelotrichaceae bacterium]
MISGMCKIILDQKCDDCGICNESEEVEEQSIKSEQDFINQKQDWEDQIYSDEKRGG